MAKSIQFEESEQIKQFHLSRTAFIIVDDKLMVDDKSSDLSHLQWLLSLSYTEDEADSIILNNARGYYHPEQGLYFYTGYDYQINQQTIDQFFKFLPEIIVQIGIDNTNTQIHGGAIPDSETTQWKPREEFGEVSKYL
jgi:hypothetical protein